jgi:DNA-binding MarR family transcriptional regulator
METQTLKEAVDPIIHEPKRLAIMAVLTAGPTTFSDLKKAADLTDGNLDAHLRRLEDAGFVEKAVRKNPLIRRQRESLYKATEKGRKAFDAYLVTMERKLAEARSAVGVAAKKNNS